VLAAGQLVSDPDYTRLKDQLIQSTGLAYYAERDRDLAERVERRLSALGLSDCGSYLSVLGDGERGVHELDALIAELTIGETYFLRHREQFDALLGVVLPDVMERNRSSRRIRIWSAGCATGAEPYSVAMLLRQELGAQLAGWEVSILATDVNRRFLAHAREGRFEEWALRGTDPGFRQSFFRQEGKFWVVLPEHKEWVGFQYHNLVKHPFPSLVNNLSAFDAILCRNVMIYFSRAAMRSIVVRFRECLVEGGWLVVGHAEPEIEAFRDFRMVSAPGVTLYQKPGGSRESGEATLFAETWPAIISAPACEEMPGGAAPLGRGWPPGQPVETLYEPAEPAGGPAAAQGGRPTNHLAQVRELADRGDWERAVAGCREILSHGGLDPAVHYYYALVLEQMGHLEEAEQSLRRALYLDRSAALPHYHLGLLLQKRDPQQAARAFKNVLELLSREGQRDSLALADGMTVADLEEMTRMHLEVLCG